MKKIFHFLLLLSSPLFSSEITYFWDKYLNSSEIESLFVRSFSESVKDIPAKLLYVDNYETHLHSVSKHEISDITKKNPAIRYITAYNKEKLVGYASFNVDKHPDLIYIRQLAVDPDHFGHGIGKHLVFSILEHYPDVHKIVLITRKVNEMALRFYDALSFSKSSYMREGYPHELYTGFEYVVNSQS